MSSTLKASRFIFMATKSYYKRFLVPPVIFIIAIVAIASQSSPAFVGSFVFVILFFLSSLLCVYPFYACDKVPQLYSALPQRRVDLVRGIYLNYLMFLSCDLVIGLAILSVFHVIGVTVSGLFFLLGLMLSVFSLIMGVELPVMFQIGFAKIQMLFNLVYFIMGFFPIMLVETFHEQAAIVWLLTHRAQLDNPLYFIGFILAAAIFLTISYRISLLVYRKKDI